MLGIGRSIIAIVLLSAQLSYASTVRTPQCRVVTIVNTVPAGGIMDATARDIAQQIKDQTGMTAVVDSRSTGEGVAALMHLKTVPADGCTVGYFRSSLFQRQVLEGTAYDIMSEFTHAAIGLKFPFVVAGNGKVPPTTYQEFVSYVKTNKSSISSAGAPNDLVINALERVHGRPDWTRPMYKGGTPQILDLLGGHTDFYVGITVPALQYAAEGKIKAYAVTSERRLRGYPNVPTLRELGTNIVEYGWASVSLPAAASEYAEWWGMIVKATWEKKDNQMKYDPAAGIVGEDVDPISATRYLNREMDKLRKLK